MTEQSYEDTEQRYGDTGNSTMTTSERAEDNVNNAGSVSNGNGDSRNGSMGTDDRSMASGSMKTDSDSQLLFDQQDATSFRERWEQVQSRFVDDPRAAVADADSLVSDVTQSLTSRFAEQRSGLERQWSQGEDVQTEDLRLTMQRYRTLFERLLAA